MLAGDGSSFTETESGSPSLSEASTSHTFDGATIYKPTSPWGPLLSVPAGTVRKGPW